MEKTVVFLDPSFEEEKLKNLRAGFERNDIDDDSLGQKPVVVHVGWGNFSGAPNEFCVVNNFLSDAYREVEAKGGNIIGFHIALKSIKDAAPKGREASRDLVLPVFGRPVCCRCFEGVSVYSTGLTRNEKDRVQFLVTKMGGEMAKKVTSAVGFVIATTVMTDAYKVAVSLKRPVLRIEWIQACWEQHQLLSSVEYQLPPFAGLQICLTEISSMEERGQIIALIVAHGGISSSALTRDCTHLVAGAGKGMKYTTAKRWRESDNAKIHLVNTSWLYQSVKAGVCLPEASFPVLEEQTGNGSSEDMQNSLGSIIPTNPATARLTHATNLRVSGGGGLCNGKTQDASSDDMYLSASRMYIICSDETEKRKLIGWIREGGGTRYVDFNTTVTHVIVGGSSEGREVTKIRQMTTSFTHFITPLWLQECSQARKQVPVEDRHAFKDQPLSFKPERRNGIKAAAPAVDEDYPGEPGSMAWEASTAPREQFLAGDRALHKGSVRTAGGADQNKKPSMPLDDAKNMQQEGGCQQVLVGKGGESRELGRASIFVDRKFCLSHSVSSKETIEAIEGAGGCVMDEADASSINPPDYMVIGHGERTEPDGMLSCQVVSTHWIHHCLEMEKIVDPADHILFQPLTCDIPLPGFDSLVVCISQYSDVERTLVRNLCHALGTRFTQKFSKRVTHLLCAMAEGEKYTKALEWGSKVATVDWLVACVRQNTVLNVDDFRPRELTATERTAGDLPTTQFPVQATLPAKAIGGDPSSQSTVTQRGGKGRRADGSTQPSGKSAANHMRVLPPSGALDPWDQQAAQWGGGGSGSQSVPATQPASRTRSSALRAQESVPEPPLLHTEDGSACPAPLLPSQEQKKKVLTRASSRKGPEEPTTHRNNNNSQKENFADVARQMSQGQQPKSQPGTGGLRTRAAREAAALEKVAGSVDPASAEEHPEAVIGVLRRRLGQSGRGDEEAPTCGPPPDRESEWMGPRAELDSGKRTGTRERLRSESFRADSAFSEGSRGFREAGRAERDESQPDVAAAIEGLLAKTNKGRLPDTTHSMEADHGLMSPEPSGISRRRSMYTSDHKRQRLTPGWITRDIESQTASEEVQTKRQRGPEDDSGNILESQFESQMVGYDDVQLGRQQMLENAKSMRRPNNQTKGGRKGGGTDAPEGTATGGYKMFAGLLRAAEANK